jgi:hypothetical protein
MVGHGIVHTQVGRYFKEITTKFRGLAPILKILNLPGWVT